MTADVTIFRELTLTGWNAPDGLSLEGWRERGKALRFLEGTLMWAIGDWLNFGERVYGETYTQAIETTGYEKDTLKQAKSVSGAYETCDRSHVLSWTHHLAATSLPHDDRSAILAEAEHGGWSVRDLKAEIRQRKNRVGADPSTETCTTSDLTALCAAGQQFGTVYADPPWLYDNQATRAATSNHYDGMTVKEICDLPIRDLAATDAHLHLWTTNAFLFECPRIFEAWGFEFRSTFAWVKPQMGIGNYWRNSHEILLTAIRGDAKRFNDHSLISWMQCKRGRHSAKPERVRGFIERASPGPFLELFGRAPAKGWTVWGNEIERSLLLPDVRGIA